MKQPLTRERARQRSGRSGVSVVLVPHGQCRILDIQAPCRKIGENTDFNKWKCVVRLPEILYLPKLKKRFEVLEGCSPSTPKPASLGAFGVLVSLRN